MTGLGIGILYGLTHSAQISAAPLDAIDSYGDSTAVGFDKGPLMIASVVSVIPSIIGGVARAGAPIRALTLARWLKLGRTVQLLAGLVIAIGGGAAAGASRALSWPYPNLGSGGYPTLSTQASREGNMSQNPIGRPPKNPTKTQ